MFTLFARPHRGFAVFALMAVLLGSGCGDSVGKRLPVSGNVLVDQQPLRGMTGTVTFIPDKSRGNESPYSASGPIDSEGRYVLSTKGKKGAPMGHYKVVVSAVPPGSDRDNSRLALHARFSVENTTPLVIEVVASPAPDTYDLKTTTR
jgi:hypothetical protein